MHSHQKLFYTAAFVFLSVLTAIQTLGQNVQPPAISQSDMPNPFTIGINYAKKNNYITPIFELKAQEEKYLASPMWKVPYLESMILLHGWVGNYDEAYIYENMLYDAEPGYRRQKDLLKGEITDASKSPLSNYRMLDALDAIENVANTRQVIMINEEHRTPFHRAFTLQLLKRLYAKGFRYFAAEALYMDTSISKEDIELSRRGYPTHKTGYYTTDPVFADAIRIALKLGYKIIPYEFPAFCEQGVDRNTCNQRRERGQAQNIYDRTLKNDPQAKILVHVGRGHNSKAGSPDNYLMAKYFQDISKIEPFTIDQLKYSERRDAAYEQPLYRFLTRNNLLQKPSVYQAADDTFYNQGAAGYDMMIFHPRTRYENGRATFMTMNGLRRAEKIDLKKLNLQADKGLFAENDPVLIQAFESRENDEAVPVDQILLYPKKEIPVLMLSKGNYLIRAMDKTGKVLREYQKNLK